MSHQGSIIKGLQASRRIQSDLQLDRHNQNLSKIKLDKQLQNLSRSRRQYVDKQIANCQVLYEKNLNDSKVTEEHVGRQKRYAAEKAKVAQQDFQKQRQRLINERNLHDDLDKRHRIIQKQIMNLQARSKFAQEDEERTIIQLSSRKQTVLKLLEQSKQRQLYHYQQSKKLSSF